MLKQLSIAAIALTVLPALAGAQQRPLDPYGRPYVTAPTQPTPGDPQMASARATVTQGRPMITHGSGDPSPAMAPSASVRDEYGNLYNRRGDRIDRSGRIIASPVTPPDARVLR